MSGLFSYNYLILFPISGRGGLSVVPQGFAPNHDAAIHSFAKAAIMSASLIAEVDESIKASPSSLPDETFPTAAQGGIGGDPKN